MEFLKFEILRSLTTEYQKKPNEVTFHKILKRVDLLVLSSIHKHMRRRRELKEISLEDLYQTAIVGLGRALTTARDEEPGEKIVARIVAYIRATIDKTYPNYKKKKWNNLIFFEDEPDLAFFHENQSVPDTEMLQNLENTFLREKLNELITKGILSRNDMKMIGDRLMQKMSYLNIGKKYNKSYLYVKSRCAEIIEILQEHLKSFDDLPEEKRSKTEVKIEKNYLNDLYREAIMINLRNRAQKKTEEEERLYKEAVE